ncbi:MAG: thiol oxidoreductase, partial [Planctomycetales bacterium]|nr:thiol oxidoreductase [Planctomycetales bacterium]
GLTAKVSGHTELLHDGRARSVAEAILWHGGEAADAREAFRNLPAVGRAELLEFLNSL